MRMVFFCCWLVAAGSVFGQDSTAISEAKSNADLFSARSGTLLERTFYYIGTVHKIEVEALSIKDILRDSIVRCLRFQSKFIFKYGTEVNKILSLDADEVDALLRSMRLIEAEMFPTKRENYTDVNFRSRGGFSIGAFYEFKTKSWKPFVQFGWRDDYIIFISQEEFKTLRLTVEDAQKKL